MVNKIRINKVEKMTNKNLFVFYCSQLSGLDEVRVLAFRLPGTVVDFLIKVQDNFLAEKNSVRPEQKLIKDLTRPKKS